MALLICSKFLRCLSTIARSKCSSKGQFTHRRRTYFEIRDIVRNFSSSTNPQGTKLERNLRRLDQDVRRMGRISRREFEEALEELKISRSATGTQSLLLIRCCGSLLPEEPSKTRTLLVEEVWKMLHNLGVPMDISHYNALLRVYLENEHSFSPTEFLADVERKGIEPNRVTYQCLVERYCQEGDIEGATHILEFMQAKQLPINENIFNSLILGHSKAGDMKSAADILNVMKHAGLEPSSETYTTLLCGYAKHDDMESIRSTLEQCRNKDIQLLDQDYMEILYTLVINNHNKHVDEIIGMFQYTIGFNQDAFNLILKLTNMKKFAEAKKILFTMSRGARDGQLQPSGNFFIRQLVRANCPIQETLAICEELREEGLNDKGLLMATESTFLQGNVENAMILLSTFKAKGYSVREHYFWPLIVSHGKAGNSEGILNILRTMKEQFELEVQDETLKDYVVPWLHKLSSKSSLHDFISKLVSAGIPQEFLVMSLVHNLLSENNFVDALKIARKYHVNLSPVTLRKPLLQAYRNTRDATSFAGMLHAMYMAAEDVGIAGMNFHSANETSPILDRYEMVGQLLLDIVSSMRDIPSLEVEKLLEAIYSAGSAISNSTAERLVEKLGNEKMTSEISLLLEKLSSSQQVNRPTVQAAPIRSEAHLRNLIQVLSAKGEPVYNVKKQLLNLYCRNRNLEKADELWQELGKDGITISPGQIAQLIDLYVSNDKLEQALNVLKWSTNKSNDFVLSKLKVIKLATLMVRKNDIEGALTLLNDLSPLEKTEENTFAHSSACRLLLNSLADQGDVDNLKKMFDGLLQSGYIEINNAILGPLVKVHFVRDDTDSAMRQFEELCVKYHCTPMKSELTCKLIEAEDAVSLQKVTDLSTKVHGEVNSLYDLVFAFVECGRIRQARKILETPGLLSRPQRVQSACKRYSNEGMVSSLEGLVEATKSLSHVDPSDIYQHLLKIYCKKNDAKNAMGLWIQIQEENLHPSDEFLIVLGNFLKNEGLPVPFVMPEASSSSAVKENSTKENVIPNKFISALEEENFIDAFEILQSWNDDIKRKVSNVQFSSLLQGLSKIGRLQDVSKLLLLILQLNLKPTREIFRNVIQQISSVGDVLTLQLIQEHLDESQKKKILYDNNLCRAYMNAGKASDYLELLEKEIDGANNSESVQKLTAKFPRSAILLLLKNHPELHAQYKKLCEKYFTHENIIPWASLWAHHALEHQYSVADEVWAQYLCGSQRIYIIDTVVRSAHQHGDLTLATYVINRLKESVVEPSSRGYAYSVVIDILLSNGKTEEAIKFVNESKSVISYENLTKRTRERLENVINEQGISPEVSQQIPLK